MGETEQVNILKDPQMLNRLNDIDHLSEKEREALLMSVDAFLRDAKTRKAHAA